MQNTKCPTCQSPQPHLHPAMAFEGEVQPCRDPYHRTVTPQKTPEKIASVLGRSPVDDSVLWCDAKFNGQGDG